MPGLKIDTKQKLRTGASTILSNKHIRLAQIRNANEYPRRCFTRTSRRRVEGYPRDTCNSILHKPVHTNDHVHFLPTISELRPLVSVGSWTYVPYSDMSFIKRHRKKMIDIPTLGKVVTCVHVEPKLVDFQSPLPLRAPKNRTPLLLGSIASRYTRLMEEFEY